MKLLLCGICLCKHLINLSTVSCTFTRGCNASPSNILLLYCLAVDPLPIEEMFYNRRPEDPLNPEYIGIRGTSKLEGDHAYYHASLPATNYSPQMAGAIMDCRVGNLNVKAAARVGQTTAPGLAHAHQQEKKRKIIASHDWEYSLPAALPVPPSTEERFGVDFVPGGDQLAAARLEQLRRHAAPDVAAEEFYSGDAAQIKKEILPAIPIALLTPQCLHPDLLMHVMNAYHAFACIVLFSDVLRFKGKQRSYIGLHCLVDDDVGEEGTAAQPACADGNSPRLQLPRTAQLPQLAPAMSAVVAQPTDSLLPARLPTVADKQDSHGPQATPSVMPPAALRGVQWVAEAGKNTASLACVICCSMLQ